MKKKKQKMGNKRKKKTISMSKKYYRGRNIHHPKPEFEGLTPSITNLTE